MNLLHNLKKSLRRINRSNGAIVAVFIPLGATFLLSIIGTDDPTVEAILLIFGIVCFVVPALYYPYVALGRPKFVSTSLLKSSKFALFSNEKSTLKYFEGLLTELCECGGNVVTTNILEEDYHSDSVVEIIGKSNVRKNIDYKRILLRNEREGERDFLKSFFELHRNTHPSVSTSVHLINTPRVVTSLFIKRYIPFVSVSIFKFDIGKSVLLITFPRKFDSENKTASYKFGIAIKNREIVDAAWSYFSAFLPLIGNPFFSIDEYDNRKNSNVKHIKSQTRKTLEQIEQIAHQSPTILHVGVFGSVARKMAGLDFNPGESEAENDLDILVVIDQEKSREKVKNSIEAAVSIGDVEWSNEPGARFYDIRTGYQLDVQVHVQNDPYYVDHPLLGCAVFANYYALYSDDNVPINSFLHIPNQLIPETERIKHFLDDERFGVNQFIHQCHTKNPLIDPRRVISINVRNLVWALVGSRPNSSSQAIKYLENSTSQNLDLNSIREILMRPTEEVRVNQNRLLTQTTEYLEIIKLQLERSRTDD